MAPLSATAAGIVLAFIASSAPSSSVDAFSPAATSHSRHHAVACASSAWRSSPLALRMSEEENATVEDSAAAANEAEAEAEEPKLDPEMVALKESIASLESDLKAKRANLKNVKEMADKYTSTGYARQVALLENNKRMRGANVADGKTAARATVLQSFLPVLDELDAVGRKYEGNAFAKTFDAGLRGQFELSLGELGASEYIVEVGQQMEVGRVVAVEEELSEEFEKGTVIRPLKSGIELSGNVVRPAEVVGSLGSESAEPEEAGEDAGEAATE